MAINFINGEKFALLADNKTIFYSHIHEVESFFNNPPKQNFVLITHNSDGKITDKPKRFNQSSSNDCDITKIKIPQNLIKWYSQNVDIEHSLIESIPIGLENSQWFQDLRKKEKLFNIKNTPKNIKNLVYLNLNINNNKEVRQPIYDMLKYKSYVTTHYGKNGLNYDNYLDNLYNHCFMVCPEGNGIDVHQPWESLYINTIPIQKKNINNRNWRELPICWVDDWKQLNDESFLISEYNRIKSTKFDLSKLDFDFWKEKILSSI
jgi:hypothetical protein